MSSYCGVHSRGIWPLQRSRSACAALTIIMLLLTQVGCTSIIRPNYTQALVDLRSGDYTLDREHAYIHFKIEHLGLSTVVGRFNSAKAALDFDPADIESLKLDGVIDVASIDMNNADLEKRLQGADWLDAERYPEATFSTVSVTQGEGNAFVIEGEFSLHGITKPMSLAAMFKGGADNLLTGKYTLGFSATGSFLRSDYEVDAFGALIADEVLIEINAEFQRAN